MRSMGLGISDEEWSLIVSGNAIPNAHPNTNPYPSSSSLAHPSLLDTSTSTFPSTSTSTALLITPTQPPSKFTALIHEYKSSIHHFFPIFTSDEVQLEQTIRSSSPLLISAILSVSYPDSSPDSSSSSLQEPRNINASLSLPYLQASALLSLYHYGRGENQLAKQYLMTATTALIKLGIAGFDNGGELNLQAQYFAENLIQIETWRRLWWECWALEIILFTVPGIGPDILVLVNETSKPKLPKRLDDHNQVRLPSFHLIPHHLPPLIILQDTSDAVYFQALGLQYQVLTSLISQSMSFSQLTSLSRAGTGIYTLARQNWAFTSSHTNPHLPARTSLPPSFPHPHLEINLESIVRLERSHLASLIAAGSIAFLHIRSAHLMIPDPTPNPISSPHSVDETAHALDPIPGTPKYLSNTCQNIFTSLRDASNYHISTFSRTSSSSSPASSSPIKYSPPSYPPMFPSIAKVAAAGNFLSLMRSPSLQTQDIDAQLTRASIIVDIQLAEKTVVRHCVKWPKKTASLVDDIRDLRMRMVENITSTAARSIIGVD